MAFFFLVLPLHWNLPSFLILQLPFFTIECSTITLFIVNALNREKLLVTFFEQWGVALGCGGERQQDKGDNTDRI